MSRCVHIMRGGQRVGEHCNTFARYEHNGRPLCKRHLTQAERYARNEKQYAAMLAAANERVQGGAGKIKRARDAPQQKKSIFLFTINSQKSIKNMGEAEQEHFVDVVEAMFSPDNVLDYVTDYFNRGDPNENLTDGRVDVAFEIGKEKHRLHAHGVVDLTHTSMYKLNFKKIRQDLQDALGYKVHFNAEVARGAPNSSRMEQYMLKSIST